MWEIVAIMEVLERKCLCTKQDLDDIITEFRCKNPRALRACPTLTVLLRRTIRNQLRRSRPEKIINVFQRIRLLFFRACGLASGRGYFASLRSQCRTGSLIPERAFLEPYLLTETENTFIDDILELLNKHGLTSHQSMSLLERLGGIIEMGQRVAKGTTP